MIEPFGISEQLELPPENWTLSTSRRRFSSYFIGFFDKAFDRIWEAR